MANNKTSIKTIPLNMKLNMNKNKNLIDDSFSFANKCNSPVYGSTLTNIHFKSDLTGNAIWDRNGERYYVEGSILKSTNAAWKNINLSDKYFFEKSSIKYDLDGLCKQNNVYCGFKLKDGKALIYRGASIDNVEYAYDAEPMDGYNIVSARLVPFNATTSSWPFITFVTIQEAKQVDNTDATAENSNITYLVIYRLYDVDADAHVAQRVVLGKMTSETTKSLGGYAQSKTGNSGKTQNSNDYHIIVSSPNFSTDGLAPDYDSTPRESSGIKVLCTIGITVLKKKMRGESELYFDNFLFSYCPRHNGYTDVARFVPEGFYPLNSNNTSRFFDANEEVPVGVYIASRKTDNCFVSPNEPKFVREYNVSHFARMTFNDASYSSVESIISYTNDDQNALNFTTASNTTTVSYDAIFTDDSPNVVATYQDESLSSQVSVYAPPAYNSFIYPFYMVRDTGLVYPTDGATYYDSQFLNRPTGVYCWGYTQLSDNVDFGSTKTSICRGASVAYGKPYAVRGRSFTTNQRYYRYLEYGNMTNADATGVSNTGSLMWDSSSPTTVYTSVGLQSAQTVPTTKAGWDTWVTSYEKNPTSYCCYNSQGSIAKIGNTNWRLLFNYRQGYISGISYGQDGYIGKLVTEWDMIEDGFYVYAEDSFVIFKNAKDSKLYKVERKAYSTLEEDWISKWILVDKRYLVGNIDYEYNAFDTVENKLSSWSSDWNSRVITGIAYIAKNDNAYFATAPNRPNIKYERWDTVIYDGVKKFANNGTIGSGQNVAYAAVKAFSPSRIMAYNSYIGVMQGYETPVYAASDVGVDIYTNNTASTSIYKYTVRVDNNGSTYCVSETAKEGLSYPVSSSGSPYNNLPIVGVDFIESYNGKFAVKIDNSVYGIVYNGIRPIGLYNVASLTDDIDSFFIVQGQYYAVVNGYISAVYYNSTGTLSSIEQIIDINGMKFIGAFPSVAYFWAPATQSIYAFTGDADLQLFVQSNRITEVYQSMYDPSSEWIFLNTNDGLYVMTQINVYKSEMLNNIHSFWSTDDGYIVVIWGADYKNTKLSLRKFNGWNTIPVRIETAFYGMGDCKTSIIDTWYIRLFKNDENDNGNITLSVKTLTDTVRECVTKTYRIKKDDWDANDCFFIRFQPNNQHSLGSSLSIESDYPIAYIGASVTEDATQLSKVSF